MPKNDCYEKTDNNIKVHLIFFMTSISGILCFFAILLQSSYSGMIFMMSVPDFETFTFIFPNSVLTSL